MFWLSVSFLFYVFVNLLLSLCCIPFVYVALHLITSFSLMTLYFIASICIFHSYTQVVKNTHFFCLHLQLVVCRQTDSSTLWIWSMVQKTMEELQRDQELLRNEINQLNGPTYYKLLPKAGVSDRTAHPCNWLVTRPLFLF